MMLYQLGYILFTSECLCSREVEPMQNQLFDMQDLDLYTHYPESGCSITWLEKVSRE